jgi:hypothetical protein
MSNFLTEIYGIPLEVTQQLYKDGILSYSHELKYQIWKHYKGLLSEGIKSYQCALDCSIHFEVSVVYVYRSRADIERMLEEKRGRNT